MAEPTAGALTTRRIACRLEVHGRVQGVGSRSFVYRAARIAAASPAPEAHARAAR